MVCQAPHISPSWESYGVSHNDIIKWKHFPHYWPFVRGIHQWAMDSPHKGQWHGALMFSLICARTYIWANNWDASDLRHHHTQYDVTVMWGFGRKLTTLEMVMHSIGFIKGHEHNEDKFTHRDCHNSALICQDFTSNDFTEFNLSRPESWYTRHREIRHSIEHCSKNIN